MHVIYIHQHFSTRKGATGTRSYEMSRRLIAAGHRVTMICGAYGHGDLRGDDGERVTKRNIDAIRVLRIAEPYSNQMSFMQRVMAFGRFARAAGRLACELDGDLVFATSTPLTVGIPGMKAGRRLGVPFVFEVRDLWPELPIALGVVRNPLVKVYLRRMERRVYKAAHRIIALAPGIKEGICRTGYPADQVAMIPNCSDLDLFHPADEPLCDPRFGCPSDLRLVFTGAHGQANGLDAVLDAAAVLKNRGEEGIRFVFIGEGGQRERLMCRSETEGLNTLITWLPPMPKEELPAVLPRMDAGMMILKNIPAFYYGTSPNKFFDYIACGLPVLNNYPGWLADMIAANRCGLAVKPNQPEAFAHAVVWMRDHRFELKEMGRRARELAEREFGRDRLAGQFVRTLEEARASF